MIPRGDPVKWFAHRLRWHAEVRMVSGMTTSDIRIAAALIEDGAGRLLLVRKKGTPWFMQAGGKVEPGEDALSALRRELREEIGLDAPEACFTPIGSFSAPAANEAGRRVIADLFRLRTHHMPTIGAEIAEAIWVDAEAAEAMPLAPLTRDYVIPLLRAQDTQSARL